MREIARRLRISRKTVRKAIEAAEGSFAHERDIEPVAKLCAHVRALKALRATNERKLRRERLTPVRLWEKLRATTHYAVTTLCKTLRSTGRSQRRSTISR